MQTSATGPATLKVLITKLRLISSDLTVKQGWAWLVLGWGKTKIKIRTFLGVQWLRLRASTAGGESSVPGWGVKILHVMQQGQKLKQ